MSEDDARDPNATADAADPMDAFEAFRGRRAQERQGDEPFPQQYLDETAAVTAAPSAPAASQPFPPPFPPPFVAPFVAPAEYAAEPPPPGVGFDYSGEQPSEPASRPRPRRLRSGLVFGVIAAVVVGVGAAVYAFAGGSGNATAAAGSSSGIAAVSTAGASTKASGAAKDGRVVLSKITVVSVGADSFTGTTARGDSVTVLIASATKFGTAARPLTRAQLVPGAVVWVRARRVGTTSEYSAQEIAAGTASTSSSAAAGSGAGA